MAEFCLNGWEQYKYVPGQDEKILAVACFGRFFEARSLRFLAERKPEIVEALLLNEHLNPAQKDFVIRRRLRGSDLHSFIKFLCRSGQFIPESQIDEAYNLVSQQYQREPEGIMALLDKIADGQMQARPEQSRRDIIGDFKKEQEEKLRRDGIKTWGDVSWDQLVKTDLEGQRIAEYPHTSLKVIKMMISEWASFAVALGLCKGAWDRPQIMQDASVRQLIWDQREHLPVDILLRHPDDRFKEIFMFWKEILGDKWLERSKELLASPWIGPQNLRELPRNILVELLSQPDREGRIIATKKLGQLSSGLVKGFKL